MEKNETLEQVNTRIAELEQKKESKKGRLSADENIELKKLQKKRDKIENPVGSSGVFVPDSILDENQIQYIDIDKIILDDKEKLDGELNDRTGVDWKRIQSLAKSIKRNNGLIQPIVLQEDGTGRYRKIAGWRRIQAHILNGEKQIKSIVLPKDKIISVDEYNLKILHENTEREGLNPYDLVRAVVHFIGRAFGEADVEQVKKIVYKVNNYMKTRDKEDNQNEEMEITMSVVKKVLEDTGIFSTVSNFVKHLTVLDMPKSLLVPLSANNISFGMATLLNRYKDTEFKSGMDFEKLISIVISNEMSINEANKLIAEQSSKKTEKTNVQSVSTKLKYLSKNVKLLDDTQIEDLNRELEKLRLKFFD